MSKYCIHPFQSIQIQNTGEVYCCCCYWTNFYSFGNIFEQSFDEIWNGEKAQRFREQFLNQEFKYCKLNECEPYIPSEIFTPNLTCEYPKQIEFSYDRRCNVRCIFCRNEINKEEELYNREKEKKIEENFDSIFTPILQKAEIVELNSAGELFASKHSMEIVKKVININPNIKFKIISNGILFTKEIIETLGLKERMITVTISMHSATEKTYNKLVKNGNFKALIENVKYLSLLKKQGFLQNLQLNFVVTSINYNEMIKFAHFAKEMQAKAFFINYHRQIDDNELEKKLDISLPTHKNYNNLIKILKNPIFKKDFCYVNDYLKNLKPTKNFILEEINKLFKK